MCDSIGSVSLRSKVVFPEFAAVCLRESVAASWKGSALGEEYTLHQIAPYIGKIKSSMAGALVSAFTREGETVYDPFCGSGTVALEAWAAGRNVIANDLSPYAVLLTLGKLFPHLSVEKAFYEINNVAEQVSNVVSTIDLRKTPKWVRSFFHPETLREILAWSRVLRSRRSYFLLSCLVGILHHQRPGFLSYPSSHTVPYLRDKKFPPDIYPNLYQYRPVQSRLERKVMRALKRIPHLKCKLARNCFMRDAAKFVPNQRVNAIITSPPYMRQLDYGRDNRLRLWCLGAKDYRSLDRRISPSQEDFVRLMRSCLRIWHHVLNPKGLCILVLGDGRICSYNAALYDMVIDIATRELRKYSVLCTYSEPIPNTRRVRRGHTGTLTETILVLRNER